jgi:hypothetical protein
MRSSKYFGKRWNGMDKNIDAPRFERPGPHFAGLRGAIPLHTRRGTPGHVIRVRRPLVHDEDVEVGDDLEDPPALGPDHLVDDVRTVGGGVQSPSAERGVLWRH